MDDGEMTSDDPFVKQLNSQFRGKDKPTNVLSFSSDEDEYLGDTIFAFETIQREAEEQGKSLKHHFTHLLIHGCLHLMGYDHEEDEEGYDEEAEEDKEMASFSSCAPVPLSTPQILLQPQQTQQQLLTEGRDDLNLLLDVEAELYKILGPADSLEQQRDHHHSDAPKAQESNIQTINLEEVVATIWRRLGMWN